jgi:predicted ATPase
MLSQLHLSGFRSFDAPTSLRLGKLSLLCGANSVGKSSVIDLLGAVAQSRQAQTGDRLLLRGSWVDLGVAEEAISTARAGDERQMQLGWTVQGGPEVLATFGEDPDDSGQIRLVERELDGVAPGAVGRHPFEVERPDGRQDLFAAGFHHLAPHRVPPQSIHAPRHGRMGPLLGPSGESTAEVLYRRRDEVCDIPTTEGRRLRVIELVSHWWSQVFAQPLRAQTAELRGVGFSLAVETAGADRLGLGQVGLGLSQSLPILALAALSRPGDLLAIQTPEAHLHPGAQHRLAGLLLDLADHGRQLLVETHSEHFVNALRLRVKSGRAPTDYALHFFEQDEAGQSRVSELSLDTKGRALRWPQGFFDQQAIDLAALLA